MVVLIEGDSCGWKFIRHDGHSETDAYAHAPTDRHTHMCALTHTALIQIQTQAAPTQTQTNIIMK